MLFSFNVRNLQSEGPVNLFPNPGNGKVFIQSDEVITSLKVNTIQGKEIYRAKGVQDYALSIDLSGIEPGIYLITLQNNKRSVTCRYIKQ